MIGTPILGRLRPEVEGLIGCFINTVVIRVDVSGDPTFREVLRQARATVIEGLRHQEAPFGRVVNELAPVRDASRTPVFQVLLVVHTERPAARELLDLKVEKGLAVRTEPHPRFYTDPTDTVPIAVPALIRNWWPMLFFCVFKAPAEGRTHIFRPNEPFAQIIVIPEEANLELQPMTEEEATEREVQSRRIHVNRPKLAGDTEWLSTTDTVFDGIYRHLHRAAKAQDKT